ncbi:MAG: preprotein translocase subunit SecE [Bacteroidota bacterium]
MKKITNHFQESLRELTEKVSWPTWAQLQQSTMIVLAATLFITLIVLVIDSGIGNGFKFIYKQLF